MASKTEQSTESCWRDDSSDYKNIWGKTNNERVFEIIDKVFPIFVKLNIYEKVVLGFYPFCDPKNT